MPEDRRYSEDEVTAIFARATEVQQSAPQRLSSGEGMSLAELQSIGREAGIAPELVAQAARELEQPSAPRMPTFLGMQLGVARTVEIGRKLSDEEWERLVVRLRVRFRTIKGDARMLMSTGIAMLAVSGLLVFVASLTGSDEMSRAISATGGVAMMGAAFAGSGALRLPGWVKKRRLQMDQLAAELLQITDGK